MTARGLAVVALVLLLPASVRAEWRVFRKFLGEDVTVLEESGEQLVLFRAATGDTLVVHRELGEEPCDIYGALVRNRTGNPYRIWVAHESLWVDPARPRSRWGPFFRTPFLEILRPPPRTRLAALEPASLRSD